MTLLEVCFFKGHFKRLLHYFKIVMGQYDIFSLKFFAACFFNHVSPKKTSLSCNFPVWKYSVYPTPLHDASQGP